MVALRYNLANQVVMEQVALQTAGQATLTFRDSYKTSARREAHAGCCAQESLPPEQDIYRSVFFHSYLPFLNVELTVLHVQTVPRNST